MAIWENIYTGGITDKERSNQKMKIWKKNISLTLSGELVQRIDTYAEKHERGNRSALIEKLVTDFLNKND